MFEIQNISDNYYKIILQLKYCKERKALQTINIEINKKKRLILWIFLHMIYLKISMELY